MPLCANLFPLTSVERRGAVNAFALPFNDVLLRENGISFAENGEPLSDVRNPSPNGIWAFPITGTTLAADEFSTPKGGKITPMVACSKTIEIIPISPTENTTSLCSK